MRMTAPLIDCGWLRTREAASGARVHGYNADPGYFFFLGFLTSFFGLLSLAMCDPPLQMDYTRWGRLQPANPLAGASFFTFWQRSLAWSEPSRRLRQSQTPGRSSGVRPRVAC